MSEVAYNVEGPHDGEVLIDDVEEAKLFVVPDWFDEVLDQKDEFDLEETLVRGLQHARRWRGGDRDQLVRDAKLTAYYELRHDLRNAALMYAALIDKLEEAECAK